MCHKSGWTSEKAAQGMIQNFVPQHPKGERSAWDSLVRITFCPRPAVGARPCSAPTCFCNDPSIRQSNRPFATSGILWFCFAFQDLIFWAYRRMLGPWPGQLLPDLLSPCNPKHQVCPTLTTLTTRRLHTNPCSRNMPLQASPLALPPPPPSAPSRCLPHAAVHCPLRKAKPACSTACLGITMHPPIRAWLGADPALVALLRVKVKRSWVRCLLRGSWEYLQEAVALGDSWLRKEGNYQKTPP